LRLAQAKLETLPPIQNTNKRAESVALSVGINPPPWLHHQKRKNFKKKEKEEKWCKNIFCA
jgi:hypothetical protein